MTLAVESLMTNASSATATTAELLHRADQIRNELWSQNGPAGFVVLPLQYFLLRAVSEHSPCSQTRLGELTGIDRSTVAEICRRLTKAGLITRTRNRDDHRAHDVRLTPAGERALATARKVDEVVSRALFAPLTHRERMLLGKLLARVAQRAE
jgi:DNA-binding MarR family transcriptional regulator